MPKSVYEQVKKQNGEAFARELRDFDNGIFEIPSLVEMLKFAGYEAGPIKEYLSALKWRYFDRKPSQKPENPFDLLKKAGYTAFYVDSLKKQLSIQKYFNKDTALCTFKDNERFLKYHIIYCIKEGAHKLKPAQNPMREDEYGVSVISIQILKEGGFLKITNRYNHLVENPDNTFNSNPDRIIPGLTEALEGYFKDITIARDGNLPEGYIFFKNKLLKVNKEFANNFMGENFYIDGAGNFFEIDKDKEIIIDNYVFNLKERTFSKIIERICSGQIPELLTKEFEGKALQLKSSKRGHKALFVDGVKILETQEGNLTFLNLPNAVEFKEHFIHFDRFLKYLFAPKVQKIGRGCLVRNEEIKHIHLPCLQEVGSDFLMLNQGLETLSLPLLKKMGDNCLLKSNLKSIILPSIEYMGEGCFSDSLFLQRVVVPNLRYLGAGVMWRNQHLKDFYAPKLNKYPDLWMGHNYHFYYHSKRKKLINNRKNIHKILKTPLLKRIKMYLKERGSR